MYKSIIIILLVVSDISGQQAWNSTFFDYIWNSSINRTMFREPVVVTPIDFSFGIMGYGGSDYWDSSGLIVRQSLVSPIVLDSTETYFNTIDEASKRLLIYYNIDIARLNLAKYLFNTNQVDLQVGLGYHHSNSLISLALPDDWISQVSDQSNDEYQYKPSTNLVNINSSISFQPIDWLILSAHYSFGIGLISLYESISGEKYLKGRGLSEGLALGMQLPIHNQINSYGFIIGINTRWKRLYSNKFQDSNNISPIVGFNSYLFGFDLNFSIIFGGKRTDGDKGYTHLLNNRFKEADRFMETFIDKYPTHPKVQNAVNIQRFCTDQQPYQYFSEALESIKSSEFSIAIEKLKIAEITASDELMIDIAIAKEDIVNKYIQIYNENKSIGYTNELEVLLLDALELSPEYSKTRKLLSDLIIKKGDNLLRYGNYNAALESYTSAITYYPDNKKLINHRYENLATDLIHSTNRSIAKADFFLALSNLKKAIAVQPSLKNILYKSMRELHEFIDQDFKMDSNDRIKDIVSIDKSKFIRPQEVQISLGMIVSEVEGVNGLPDIIDRVDFDGNLYEMWTYSSASDIRRYYFKDYLLIRIEKE